MSAQIIDFVKFKTAFKDIDNSDIGLFNCPCEDCSMFRKKNPSFREVTMEEFVGFLLDTSEESSL